MFYNFCFNKVPIIIFLPKSDKIPIPTAIDQYTNCPGRPNFSEFLELKKYSKPIDCYRLFCFLTDSVFHVLFAYFDESMASIGGMNHREVGIQ